MELMAAMKASPSHIGAGECDYTPPLEMLGIYVVHATITKMAALGELDISAATYLNAALGCHAFCILHHCTHESISQSNPEHEHIIRADGMELCVLKFSPWFILPPLKISLPSLFQSLKVGMQRG
jgi:hypothetical protein